MVVGSFNLGLRQVPGLFAGHTQAVCNHDGAFHVPALDKHGARAHGKQLFARSSGIFQAGNGHAGEHLCLWPVGGQQVAAWQHFVDKGGNGVFLQQAAAALAYGNRVYNQRKVALSQLGGNSPDDGGRKKHAGFCRLDGKALKHGAQLQPHKVRVGRVDARNAKPVLRGQGRNNAHAIAAEGHDGFDICLNACAAAGIRTGNGEDVWGSKHIKPLLKSCVIILLLYPDAPQGAMWMGRAESRNCLENVFTPQASDASIYAQ